MITNLGKNELTIFCPNVALRSKYKLQKLPAYEYTLYKYGIYNVYEYKVPVAWIWILKPCVDYC